MTKFYALLFVLCPLFATAGEHHRFANWFFGQSIRMSFPNGVCLPTIDTITNHGTIATLSDTTGQIDVILSQQTFRYRDGTTVRDTMYGIADARYGRFLYFVQRTMIVPHPASGTFLAFSIVVKDTEHTLYVREISFADRKVVRTEVVDIGAQVADYGIVENASGDGYWLLVSGIGILDLHSFPITASGIGAPVRSPWTSVNNGFEYAVINCSPDGRKIARVTISDMVLLYDFDPATGMASGETAIRLGKGMSSRTDCEFSPDGSKLYVNISSADTWLVQFDLSSGIAAEIERSMVEVANTTTSTIWFEGDLQLAPDGRIYFTAGRHRRVVNGSETERSYLGIIACPNLAGTACNVDVYAYVCPYTYELPRTVFTWMSDRRTFGTDTDSTITVCANATLHITPSLLPCATYEWRSPDDTRLPGAALSLGSTNAVSGTYRFVQSRCGKATTARYNVQIVPAPEATVRMEPATLCPTGTVDVRIAEAMDSILWDDGSTGETARYTTAGSHTVRVTRNGCSAVHSFMIDGYEATPITNPDTLVIADACAGGTVTVHYSIVNPGRKPVGISAVACTNTFAYSVIAPSVLPATIAPGDSLTIVLSVASGMAGPQPDSMLVTLIPCSLVKTILLVRMSAPSAVQVFIPDTVARIGTDTFAMPIHVHTTCDLVGADRLVYDVRYDARIFHLTGVRDASVLQSSAVANMATIRLQFPDLPASYAMQQVAQLLGTVLLGPAYATTFHIDPIRIPSYVQRHDIHDGSLVTEACAMRLMRFSFANPLLVSARYDASGGILHIGWEGGSSAMATVLVYDLCGKAVARHRLPAAGTSVPVSVPCRLPRGAYIVHVQSGAMVATAHVLALD